MDYTNIIQPKRLTNMQEMEVHVNGPNGANRLFMYSGMAEVELCGGMPHPRWSLEVVCFDIGSATLALQPSLATRVLVQAVEILFIAGFNPLSLPI